MFNEIKRKWGNIDKAKSFKTLNFSDEWLRKKANEVGDEITALLEHEKGKKNSSLQNDYIECAELTLAIIGYVHREDVSHHRPGATHSTRWMSQVLYSQKIYMWADQMNYDNETVSKLHRLVTFLVLFYVPAWLKCNIGVDAAINDLNFHRACWNINHMALVWALQLSKNFKSTIGTWLKKTLYFLCAAKILQYQKEVGNKWQIVFYWCPDLTNSDEEYRCCDNRLIKTRI